MKIWSTTRLHSRRMHTARALTVSPSMLCAGGECLLWGCLPPCVWGGACSRGGRVVCQHALRQAPPCEQNSWHTLMKILPCPKLRLRAVMMALQKLHKFTLSESTRLCYLSFSSSIPRFFHLSDGSNFFFFSPSFFFLSFCLSSSFLSFDFSSGLYSEQFHKRKQFV